MKVGKRGRKVFAESSLASYLRWHMWESLSKTYTIKYSKQVDSSLIDFWMFNKSWFLKTILGCSKYIYIYIYIEYNLIVFYIFPLKYFVIMCLYVPLKSVMSKQKIKADPISSSISNASTSASTKSFCKTKRHYAQKF